MTLAGHYIQIGRQEGLQEGQAKGRQEGQGEAALEMARRMKSKGVPIAEIVFFTGLTEEEVQKP